MALKQWMKDFQPISIYIVLTLTIFYFLVQLVVCYITHSLTLTIDSYLMLCNLIALFGCIITIKISDYDDGSPSSDCNFDSENSAKSDSDESGANREFVKCSDPVPSYLSSKRSALERRLKNTFGWARVDVLVMLIGCVVFSSLCFSSFIEAIQILFHISHNDEMHYPLTVFCIGAFGLVLNGLAYLLIGGYTFHHCSCLRVTSSGMVVLKGEILGTSGQRKLHLMSQFKANSSLTSKEMCRDVIGSLFVMIAAAFVFFVKDKDHDLAKFIDPVISIMSAIVLLTSNFPYMKESCYILLQTIPNHINIDSLCKELMNHFPTILNIHDLHIWEFTRRKTFLTAHIIFMNPQVYANMRQDIIDFFHEQGISVVTIQPEFFKDSNDVEMISSLDTNCLIKCASTECYRRYCCDLVDAEALDTICIAKLESTSGCCPKRTAAPVNCEQNQPIATENKIIDNDIQSSKETVSNDVQFSKETKTNYSDENNHKLPEEMELQVPVTRCNQMEETTAKNVGHYLQTDL